MSNDLSAARASLMEATLARRDGDLPAMRQAALKCLSQQDVTGPELTQAANMLFDADFGAQAMRALKRHCEGKAPLAEGFARLGAAHFEEGKPGPAARALSRALALAPDDRQSAFLLADLRLQAGEAEAARAIWRKVFAARPEDADIRMRAATQAAHFGARDLARTFVEEAAPLHPDPEEYAFMAAAITGDAPPPLPDPGYIARFFDRTAGHYDLSLAGVQYRGPEVLAEGLEALGIGPGAGLVVLDAGCGSGLSAPVLGPVSARLDGLDISPGILEEAAKTGAYETLFKLDLAREELPERGLYDLIIAMDVLIYAGDLGAPLSALARGLAPAGRLFFTAERAGGDTGWELTPTGRYRHSEAYLRQALAAAGFAPPDHLAEVALRNEFRRPVSGFAVSALLA